jgi:hypothetical protein
VRQPISTRSVARWTHDEKALRAPWQRSRLFNGNRTGSATSALRSIFSAILQLGI